MGDILEQTESTDDDRCLMANIRSSLPSRRVSSHIHGEKDRPLLNSIVDALAGPYEDIPIHPELLNMDYEVRRNLVVFKKNPALVSTSLAWTLTDLHRLNSLSFSERTLRT